MLIVHRCIVCGHPDYWSLNSNREGSAIAGGLVEGQRVADIRLERVTCHVPQCCRRCRWGSPEIADHYQAGSFGVLVAAVVDPGALANGCAHPGGRFFTCCCDDCKVFYVGAVASAEMAAAARNASGQPTMPALPPDAPSDDLDAPDDDPGVPAPVFAGQAGVFDDEENF